VRSKAGLAVKPA